MTAADRGQHIVETTIPGNRARTPVDARRAAKPIPVIARIVWHDREEWWPARAIAWTDDTVNVRWPNLRGETVDEWIPAEDVKRVVVVRSEVDAST